MHRTNDEEVSSVLTSATENATNINPTDASTNEQEAKYRKFSKYNRGWNGPKRENKEVNRNQDNLAIFDALAGQVDLTSYQKKKGRRTLSHLNLPKLGREVSLVAFAVCILVANDDVHDGHRYWPTASNSDEPFQRVADGLKHGENTILSMMLTVDSRRDEAGRD